RWPRRGGSTRGCLGSAPLRTPCAGSVRAARASGDSAIRSGSCRAAPTREGAAARVRPARRRQSVPANQSRLYRTGWNPAISNAVLARPKEGVSLYGPTSTRVRLFVPGVSATWKPLSISVCRIASTPPGLTAITCQYDPGGNSDEATIPVVGGVAAGFSPAAGCEPCAGWVVGGGG